jgi:hypothetical protein
MFCDMFCDMFCGMSCNMFLCLDVKGIDGGFGSDED